ncbi:hypothetical protein FF011L_28800 [Roseimaritima multifibrata]|uniref:Sulfatase n=1 Tax=Roseimaritima multifibrata TaxID=1930274 RepID=A0A517MGT7_9BACT|nr:hypothetical protein [Roseimaritima multifibrata]QDS94102.1 hypothetical protein FF011L_28800 [Roseimaritima multifibrata]
MDNCTLVLSLQGLANASLGPYGCSWNQTPQLDEMAAAGTLFDRCVVQSDDSIKVLQSLWQSLPKEIRLSVVSDHDPTIQLAGKHDCQQVFRIPAEETDQPSEEVETTGLANLLAAGLEVLLEPPADENAARCVWLHSDFLVRHWDAPRKLLPLEEWADDGSGRQDTTEGEVETEEDMLVYSDLDNPLPVAPGFYYETVKPPQLEWTIEQDPDELLAWLHTYAAQIQLVDVLMTALLEAIEDLPIRVVLLGTSGFNLGENRRFGESNGPLHSPRLQVPFIAVGDGIPHTRCRVPCTPQAAMNALFEAEAENESGLLSPEQWAAELDPFAPAIQSRSKSGAVAITTPDWFYCQTGEEETLYVKPDDRGDVNNIASRVPDVVEKLQSFIKPPETPST